MAGTLIRSLQLRSTRFGYPANTHSLGNLLDWGNAHASTWPSLDVLVPHHTWTPGKTFLFVLNKWHSPVSTCGGVQDCRGSRSQTLLAYCDMLRICKVSLSIFLASLAPRGLRRGLHLCKSLPDSLPNRGLLVALFAPLLLVIQFPLDLKYLQSEGRVEMQLYRLTKSNI